MKYLLIFFCIIVVSCQKEIEAYRLTEAPYRLSVTEYVDSLTASGFVWTGRISLHWHEPTYKRDSLEKYRYLDGQRILICYPLYGRWQIAKDTCVK